MPNLIEFSDIQSCTEQLVDDISACLRNAIEKRGRATLVVSGGRTPNHIFPVLSRADLAWENVFVTLADERWVGPDHSDSNEGLTRRRLIQEAAVKARFVGLKTKHGNPFDGCADVEVALANLVWPLDGVYLGMGEDGHIASLFPGDGGWQDAPGRALAVGASEQRQARMSLTPCALLDSRHIFLVITGSEKRTVFDAAMLPGPVIDLPVRVILKQNKVPVTIYMVN